jgi:very-short-patch-repair endonuclease
VSKSDLESILAFQMRAVGLPEWEREFQFHPDRRWRFDFAFPEHMLAVEVEGGVFVRGRHNRGAGFIADCEKMNEAALLGWRVLRIPGPWVETGEGLAVVERALKEII